MSPPRLLDRLRSRVARLRADGAAGDDWRVDPGTGPHSVPCDWAWRPDPWARPMVPPALGHAPDGTRLAPGARLFHDCPTARIAVEQGRAVAGAAAHDLRIVAQDFSGTFLSLALDLPEAAARGLRRSHIVGVSTRIRGLRSVEAFVRLNVRQGPNTEQFVAAAAPAAPGGDTATVEFDLGFDAINPVRLEAAWVDLIFERPANDPIRIDDLVVIRRPRADL